MSASLLPLSRSPEPAESASVALLAMSTLRAAEFSAAWRPVPHELPASSFGVALPIAACSGLADALRGRLPEALRSAVHARRCAFLAGRLCAEHALSKMGIVDPVPRGDAGEPLWPVGSVGSITHTSEMAYAVAMPVKLCAGIGIDSELMVDRAGVADIQMMCCTAREREQLFNGRDDEWRATAIFSAKEALYKAIHGHLRRFVDFDEVEVLSIERMHGRAVMRLSTAGLGPGWSEPIEARIATIGRTVHTVVTIR